MRRWSPAEFKFEEDVTQGNDAVLMWTMFLKHPRLNGGLVVSGSRFHAYSVPGEGAPTGTILMPVRCCCTSSFL